MAQRATFGLFLTRAQTNQCVDILEQKGFTRDTLSVLVINPLSLGEQKALEAYTSQQKVIGLPYGGILGGTLDLLAGIALLTIPGLGSVVVGGSLISLMSRVNKDGFVSALVSLGLPLSYAWRYAWSIENGNALLSVACDDESDIKMAKEIFLANGAGELFSTGEYAKENLSLHKKNRDIPLRIVGWESAIPCINLSHDYHHKIL